MHNEHKTVTLIGLLIDTGATAAHDAAAAGNVDTLQWLYKNTSCKPDDQDGTGATALHLACR